MSETINYFQTEPVDLGFDVQKRLDQLHEFYDEWRREDQRLALRLGALDLNKKVDAQKAVQIVGMRRKNQLIQVKRPLEAVDDESIQYEALYDHIISQYAKLTMEQSLFWLANLKFLITPEFRVLTDKINWVCEQTSFGQHRNFLLGGPSGNGKTTLLNALTAANLPTDGGDHNHVPIVGVIAPVSQRSAIPLYSQMVLGTGINYLASDKEDDLFKKVIGNFSKCGVKLLLVDEVEQMTEHKMRRRLLDVSNWTEGVCIVCASCNPIKFVEDDVEIAGRWQDHYELEAWEGDRLVALLAFVELLLPLTERSFLSTRYIQKKTRRKEAILGPAETIAKCTKGILRDILMLIYEATVRVIRNRESKLTSSLLEETWADICNRPINTKSA